MVTGLFWPDEAAGDRERAEREAEIRRKKKLLIFAAFFSLPLLLSMFGMMFHRMWLPRFIFNPYFQFAVATPVQAHQLQAIVLDKTGTITRGEPALTDVVSLSGFTREDVLFLSASAKRASEHPLGQAVVSGAQREGLTLAEPHAFRAVPGQGMIAEIEGKTVQLGGQPPPPCRERAGPEHLRGAAGR